MGDPVIVTRPEDGVAVIRIDRPEKRNALDLPTRHLLAETFAGLATDDSVRAAVITGGPRVFVAGTDITTMVDAGPIDMMLRRVEDLLRPIKDFPKPLIAAVNGWALGGGCELAMQADIIVAGHGASFGQPEVRLAVIPGSGGTQRLIRAVGKYKAMRMLMTGEPVSAQEAYAMGLVSELVADERVQDRAVELAQTLAALPPLALRKLKEVVLAGMDQPLDQAMVLERNAFQVLFGSTDQKEGMGAFLEKRPPSFTGR